MNKLFWSIFSVFLVVMLLIITLKTGTIRIILPIMLLTYAMYGVYVMLFSTDLLKGSEKKDNENGNEAE